MATQDLDQAPTPPLAGAALALAFVATGSGRIGQNALASAESLGTWLRSVGLASASADADVLASPSRARTLAVEAVALRQALARLFEATSAGRPHPPEALFAVNRVLDGGPRTTRLESGPGGEWTLIDVDAGQPPHSLLAPVARAAAELLISVDPSRLRRCDGPECGIWFVDTSKAGRRRWCSMTSCGNRQKAARHRRRRAQQG